MKNDSVIIEIVCPATSRTYDFVICTQMNIRDVIEKVSDEIMEFEVNKSLFTVVNLLELFSDFYKSSLNKNLKIYDYNIKSGCRLMLV